MHYTELESIKNWLKGEFAEAMKEAFKNGFLAAFEEMEKQEKIEKIKKARKSP